MILSMTNEFMTEARENDAEVKARNAGVEVEEIIKSLDDESPSESNLDIFAISGQGAVSTEATLDDLLSSAINNKNQ